MSADTLGLSCAHGMLARSCEVCELEGEIARLTRELEAARKDAERYRWLRDESGAFTSGGNHEWWLLRLRVELRGPTLDAAIDAARKIEQ